MGVCISQPKIKLIALDMSGRPEPIRLLLHFGGIKFEDKRLTDEELEKLKKAGNFKYDLVPVLEIDGKQYSHSQTILEYAKEVSGLKPKNSKDILKIEETLQNFEEIYNVILATFNLKDNKEEQIKSFQKLATEVVPTWLQNIEDILVANGSNGYIVGDFLTYGEVILYTNLLILTYGFIKPLPTNCLEKYHNIQKMMTHVKSHSIVKDWYENYAPKK